MNDKEIREQSRLLSLVLRHRPELIGIKLDEAGWTDVSSLLEALAAFGRKISEDQLRMIVATSDKKRFAFSNDHSLIRANHGHSVAVTLGLKPVTPPDILYHGTAKQYVNAISRQGLLKQERRYVHLHVDPVVAITVGKRHGESVLLSIDASAMHEAGFLFYVTSNDVWFTENVPPEYINFEDGVKHERSISMSNAHELQFYEDDPGNISILPISNWQHCERELEAIAKFSDKHLAPDGVGWTDVYRLGAVEKTVASLKMTEVQFINILSPHSKQFDRLLSPLADIDAKLGIRSIGFGPSRYAGIVADLSGEFVASIWCLLPEVTAEEKTELTNMLSALSQIHPLLLVNWQSSLLLDLRSREQIERYLEN